ncbi:chemotaxis protein CheB [Pontibacter chitinilyticus]|uniref:chemotaxis protein CheB n=1 Tax=Pontibacter chitinilyticus TaxID=2674989 RepID=UPI00321B38F6
MVTGTSAGGMQALTKLLSKLPADLPAAIFVVQHLSIDSNAKFLVDRLNRFTELSCEVATDRQAFAAGSVYLAPADIHYLSYYL